MSPLSQSQFEDKPVQIHVRVSEGLYRELRKHAAQQDVSVNRYLVDLLTRSLKSKKRRIK